MADAAVNQEIVRRALHEESNRALARGALFLAGLGLSAGLLVVLIQLSGAAQDLWLPAGFAFFAGLCCLAVHRLARAGRMRGVVSLSAFVVLGSLPTFFFVACHFLLPAGAATYLTGPISYLYLVIIAGSGFLFDPRVSLATGLAAALGLMLSFSLGREHLLALRAADATLRQDFISPAIWGVKAFMMAFAGALVAGLSVLTRRLILRLIETREREARVSRLFGEYVSPEVKERIVAEKA